MLSADDSPNYNMMWFENSEVFLLYYDNSENEPYELPDNITQSHPTQITWEIRLPQQLHLSWWYWLLDTENALIWKDWELPKDDAIVDRQIRWIYNEKPFVVYSTQSTTRSRINSEHDSIFRENDINWPLLFNFGVRGSPIIQSLNTMHQNNNDVPRTVISEYEADIKDNRFNDFFEDDNFQNNSLRFSLLNLLKTTNSGQYYPFLEYYADFWTDISDKYYTIDGEWNYKDFQVNTIIQKPTVKETVLWNFTSIF